VINRTAAQRLWPGEAAVGKSLHLLDREMPVVGVVADGKYRTLGEAPRAMVYVPLGRRYSGEMFLLARGAPSGPSLGRELRDLVRSLDADIPIQTNASYAQLVGMSLLPNRVAAGAAGAFGLAGLVLAAIGLYGVLSYAVGCRTREVGIRLALGADVECLRRTVLMDGVRLVGVGLLVGLPVALGASWLLRGMLYGMGPLDPATYAGVAGLLTAVGGAASYLPARRATRVDPVQALRSE